MLTLWADGYVRSQFVKELLRPGSTLIVLGPGGGGKTTVAAALAMASAQRGLNTGIITVDPARRLRDALGLARLGGHPTRIDARRLRAAGLDPALKLSAMVLDVKRTWDSLATRFIKDPDKRRQILENSFYRNLTERFAGAEAYAALEQLLELHSGGGFDLEVVDTPPAAHAFEFIEAPTHLARLLDSRATRWLLQPSGPATRNAIGLAGRTASFVVNQLDKFAGTNTLAAIAQFFGAAADATGEIVERLRRTEALLRTPGVHFVLVVTPEDDRLREALELAARMDAAGLRLCAVVINRTLDERTFDALMAAPGHKPVHLADIEMLRGMLERGRTDGRRLDAVVEHLEAYRADQCATAGRAARFARELPRHIELAVAPEVAAGVRDLRAVAKVAAALTEVPAGRKFLANAAASLAPPQPSRRREPRRAEH